MSLRRATVRVGVAAFALSWFLPVIRGTELVRAVPGWLAFWLALVGLWHPSGQPLGTLPLTILAGLSALTNAVMVVVIVATIRRSDIRPRWAWGLLIAGTLNAWWLVLPAIARGDLRSGYYLWWLSFFVVGLGSLGGRPVASHYPTNSSEVRTSQEPTRWKKG